MVQKKQNYPYLQILQRSWFKIKVLLMFTQFCVWYPEWKLQAVLLRVWAMMLDIILETTMTEQVDHTHWP